MIDTIRENFLKFFHKRDHLILKSAPLVTPNDPSLLFCNAGMVPFKNFFLGIDTAPKSRIVSAQKCIRAGGKHNDLENVGHTIRHATFFEMLGNFSFGDYYKEKAVQYGWQVSQEVFEFDPKRIWITVHVSDSKTKKLWEQFVPKERIIELTCDNLWEMGSTGPCGYCTEMFFDRGSRISDSDFDPDDERYLEFANLVFMEFEKHKDGTTTALPKKNVDTGSGLERIAMLKGDHDSIFQIAPFKNLIASLEDISKHSYQENSAPFHVIADHIRSLAFAIAEGIMPSNTDEGYVLRKIIRRAVRYGKMIDLNEPFLERLLPTLIAEMGGHYTELQTKKDLIADLLTEEEEAFHRTLKRGTGILQTIIAKSKKSISGEDAFKLKDTYGLPFNEIKLIAHDYNMKVDEEAFLEYEKKAKELSRKNSEQLTSQINLQELATIPPTTFIGYDKNSCETTVVAIFVQAEKGWERVDKLEEGAFALLFLETTPFYAEKGGQVGDSGFIADFEVKNCSTPYKSLVAHYGELQKKILCVGDQVQASIDSKRRNAIAKHHTATHLLHFALREVLGDSVTQAGSWVGDKKLRLDINYHRTITPHELQKIVHLINEKIVENSEVNCYVMDYIEAKKRADIIALFTEKYGKEVRVVDIDYSKELCGGTHAKRTGDLGLFALLDESSIAKGVRRIEATCGMPATKLFYEQTKLLDDIYSITKVEPKKFIKGLIEENSSLKKELKAMRNKEVTILKKNILEQNRVSPHILSVLPLTGKELPPFADSIMKEGSHIKFLAIGAKQNGKCYIMICTRQDSVYNAKEIANRVASIVQGGGGGNKLRAQVGGNAPNNLADAMEEISKLLAL